MIETRGQKIFLTLLLNFLILGSLQARPYIHIVGSSALYPYAVAVAENFHLKKQYPTPLIESTGTGGGIKIFCAGIGKTFPDIVLASRPLSTQERAYCARRGVTALTEVTLGFDGIVIATPRSQTPFPLTQQKLYQALAAKIKGQPNPYFYWSEIDPQLPFTKIRFLGPSSASGTRETFTEYVFKGQNPKMRSDKGYSEVSDQETVIVQKLQLEPQALGIFSFGFLKSNQDKVMPFAIEGILPDLKTIQSGQYPLSRLLYLYVKNSHLSFIEGLDDFLEEFISKEAAGTKGYLHLYGFIPLLESQRQHQEDQLYLLIQAQG